MQNLLRPRVARAGTTTSVAAFCERRLFSPARVQQDSPADAGQQNLAITDHRYSTAGERSRARKGAEKQDSNPQARFAQPNPARSGLRALAYSLRLCYEGLE